MEGGKNIIHRKDLLYSELSYQINGALFEVFYQLGAGHKEKYYQKALAEALKKRGLNFQREVYVPLKFDGKIVGKYFLDFVIEGVIAVELKQGKIVPRHVIEQTKQYLSALDLKLGIIGCFTYDCVIIKRIPNEH